MYEMMCDLPIYLFTINNSKNTSASMENCRLFIAITNLATQEWVSALF